MKEVRAVLVRLLRVQLQKSVMQGLQLCMGHRTILKMWLAFCWHAVHTSAVMRADEQVGILGPQMEMSG